MIRKRYYQNEGLGLTGGRIKVYQMPLFTTTNGNDVEQF